MNRQKTKTIFRLTGLFLLTVAAFAFTGLVSGLTTPASDFEIKVDSFLKKYSADFVVSKENLDGTGQQHTVHNTIWTKKITLKSRAPIKNNYNQTSYQRLYLAFYKFADNNRSKAAMDSLLNCFGGDCGKIKWGAEGQSSKTTPCIFIFNETEIISCHINCERENGDWTKYKHDIELYFGSKSSSIMETGCGGPINFKKF
jgi:hypothetical protein